MLDIFGITEFILFLLKVHALYMDPVCRVMN